jgi:GT2 family glycosyltransferase
MSVEVIVPYRRGSSDRRRAAFEHVVAHYERAGFTVRTADNDPWAPGRARNLGAAVSTAEVLVFVDADTVCPPMAVLEAHELAAAEPGLVFAYDLYLRLTRESTERALADTSPNVENLYDLPCEQPIFGSGSMGAAAVSAACFEELGGFDSSYVGWGYEDLDFVARATGRYGRCRRVAGPAWHLWHGDRREDGSPDDSFPSEVAANLARWRLETAPAR